MVFDSATTPDVRLLAAAISAGAVLTATLIAQSISDRRDIATQQAIRLREIEDSLRNRKGEAYADLLDLVSAFMQSSNKGNRKKAPTQQKTLDKIEKFQNAIMLWGSPTVVNAWLGYRSSSESGASNNFRHVDPLYLAIRKDIGLSNEGLESHQLLQVYLKDPDEIHALMGEE